MSEQNGFQAALTALANAQAIAQQTTAATQQTLALMMQAQAESAQRFARIEAELSTIRAILVRHEQLLQNLPDAIRQRIGYQLEKQP